MIKQIGIERWYAMGQIYAIIPDILSSLQLLASSFLSTQINSIDELSGEIFFRFDNYETDFFVVPFLIELVTQAFPTDEREIVVRRLESIVWEQSPNNIEQWTQEMVLQWLLKYVNALNAQDFSVDTHDKDDTFGTTMDANFFTSPPPLILMKEYWEVMQDFLFDLFSREGNPFAQSRILLCLCRIFLYIHPGNLSLSLELRSLIKRVAKDEIKHPLIRVAASLMHLRFLEAQVDESIIQVLLDLLRKDAIVNEWDVLWHANSTNFRLIDHVGLTLRLLSPQMGSLILPSLLEISASSGASFSFFPVVLFCTRTGIIY